MKQTKTVMAAICVAAMLSLNATALGTTDYVIDGSGKELSIPTTHNSAQMIRDLGEKGGSLSQPSDLYIDSNDNIFIADTGNNRIVKLDKNCNYITSFDCNGTLNKPGGVFISANDDIYVADTLNERIVHMSRNGEFIEQFVKPNSELIDENATFQISKIGITQQGFLYTMQGQYFMMIDANNDFKGYVGDNRLGFSLKRLLIRTFASKEQQDKLIKDTPTSYYSFDIGNDGLIYATTGEDVSSNQIQKINMVGDNVYPEKVYGEKYYNKETNRFCNPRFVDISVDSSGIVYVIDAYSCKIFVYDQNGNMLAVFGGKGDVKGKFNQPTAIDISSSGNVFVLDEATGFIHNFERTSFMDSITNAVNCYAQGQYPEAESAWRAVLDIDANYPVANKGIGDALYKQKKVKEAMRFYKLSDSKSGYGTAFSLFEYNFFRNYFGIIIVIAASAVAIVIFVIIKLKKHSDKFVETYYSGGKEQ